MLLGYDPLARFPLAGDDGRIGRQDEGRRWLFGLFDFGGFTLGGAALGADALLVLLPEPGEEDEGPYGYHGGAGDDGGDYGGFGAVALLSCVQSSDGFLFLFEGVCSFLLVDWSVGRSVDFVWGGVKEARRAKWGIIQYLAR